MQLVGPVAVFPVKITNHNRTKGADFPVVNAEVLADVEPATECDIDGPSRISWATLNPGMALVEITIDVNGTAQNGDENHQNSNCPQLPSQRLLPS